MDQPSHPKASESPRPDPLNVLMDASAMLLASGTVQSTLNGIVDLARRVIAADAYAVWRAFDAGHRWRVIASHKLPPTYRTELTLTEPTLSAKFQAVEDVYADPSLASFHDAYKSEGITSMLVLPLRLEGDNAATITFYWRTRKTFSPIDLAYSTALANLSAAALTIAELHDANNREQTRLRFLADASSALASSLDYEATLQRVAKLAVPHVADWCTVHVLENGVPTRLVVAHADPGVLEMAKDFSLKYPEQITEDRGLGLVLKTGESEVYYNITDAMIAAAALSPQHLEDVRALKLTSSILVALKSRSKILGAIRFLATDGRNFTPDDLRLAEDLARRAAAAIENAQLHRAVLDQENKLRLSHSAAHMGSWNWDLVNSKIFWSEEFKALHGLPPDSPSGFEDGAKLVHPDDREAVLNDLDNTLASTADQLSSEHRAITRDGRVIWVHSRGRIERDANGKATSIAGITIDVTERRKTEEGLRRTEKLAAAGRLAATVAHEINNPLEALVNLIYLAKNTPGLPPDALTLIQTADGELARMAHIVRQTLGFYRESVHPKATNIGATVTEVSDLYRSRIAAKSIQLNTDIRGELSACVIGGEIKQVVANLLSNAIDATPPGGSITIAAANRDAHSVQITVTDTGHGIPATVLPQLFEPFFTTKSDVGTGLGLWVSKGIVEKHKGTLTASTTEGQGATFTVTLPIE